MKSSSHVTQGERHRGATAFPQSFSRARGSAAAAVVVMLAAALGLGSATGWFVHLAFLLAGVALSALWFRFRMAAQLHDIERACMLLQYGDLSQTVPETGTPGMRRIAAVLNSVSADLQEVLLLFAHLLRSARSSAELVQLHVLHSGDGSDRVKAAEIVDDIQQMEEMIHDFKYFRVRVEDDVIVDTGINTPQQGGIGAVGSEAAERGMKPPDTSPEGGAYREEGITDERQTQRARGVSGVTRG